MASVKDMKKGDYIRELHFSYDPEERKAFRKGKLGLDWKARYPDLFDDDDLRLYKNQHKRYHFCEWYASILFYKSMGYFSMSKYGAETHKFKRPLLKTIVPSDMYEFIVDDWAGMPDLLVYSPDKSDYFFCEVKGPGDRFHGRQLPCAKQLWKMSGKPICVLHLHEI